MPATCAYVAASLFTHSNASKWKSPNELHSMSNQIDVLLWFLTAFLYDDEKKSGEKFMSLKAANKKSSCGEKCRLLNLKLI